MIRFGRTVHYVLSAYDVERINRRRKDAHEKMPWHQALKSGAMVHVGNTVCQGDEFPMVIVKDWGGAVNGQVLLDGSDTYWATSVYEDPGKKPGSWHWPERDDA